MVAQAWKIYNKAKKKIGNGTMNLAATTWRMTLHTSASSAATLSLSTFTGVGSEVAEANGYSSSGKALTSEVWTVGTTTTQYKFDCDDPVWTGTGGTIPNIKFAVIWASNATSTNQHVLCFSSLTSTQFTLGQGNTLTIQMASTGVFTMS